MEDMVKQIVPIVLVSLTSALLVMWSDLNILKGIATTRVVEAKAIEKDLQKQQVNLDRRIQKVENMCCTINDRRSDLCP